MSVLARARAWWRWLWRCRACDGAGHVSCAACCGTGQHTPDYMCVHCPCSGGRVTCPRCRAWEPDELVQLRDAEGKYVLTVAVQPRCAEVRLPVYGGDVCRWVPEDAPHEANPPELEERVFRRAGKSRDFLEVRP